MDEKKHGLAGIPRYGRALVRALSFSSDAGALLKDLRDEEWLRLLPLCDALQTTLLIGYLGRGHLPGWVGERIDRNYRDNSQRFERLQRATSEISGSLRKGSIDSTVLKGFTHWNHFIPDPALRSQGDIDIWCRRSQVCAAKDLLAKLGYRSVGRSKGRHLDPMIRETTWAWSGDYYAPDLPIPVDLHFQLWDHRRERIEGPDETAIWERRCETTPVGGVAAAQLDLTDAVSFSALHVLMHLLHGDVRLQRIWELAFFLKRHREDDVFWGRWQGLYTDNVRRLQIIAFVLSDQWFGCGLPERIIREKQTLPDDIRLWLRRYGSSPLQSLFSTNKDELWLNLCLLRSYRDKALVLARRLFPLPTGQIGFTASSANEEGGGRIARRLGLLMQRATHHLVALPLTFVAGVAWWWRCQASRSRRHQR